ncbi:MAG: hypothetical protein AAF743_03955 [Planctomycetota bacterium]
MALDIGKVYRTARPRRDDPDYTYRIVDEDGEDYLYPKAWFSPVTLTPKARRALAAAG